MRGGVYPLMPFNQQMTIPRRLTLETTADGIRLHQQPIEELQSLVRATDRRSDVSLEPWEDVLAGFDGELYDVELKLEASPGSRITIGFHGHQLIYEATDRTLSGFGKTAQLPPSDGPLDLRIVIDRTSMELFAREGRIVMSFAFVPDTTDCGLSLVAERGQATVTSWEVRELKSVWTPAED